MEIIQTPSSGERRVHYCGDRITFTLKVIPGWKGTAFLRTNLGHDAMRRLEIIERVEKRKNPLGRDWYDIPMTEKSSGFFQLVLGLSEVGHFDAKCYFLKEGKGEPCWSSGGNVHINVSPADACMANTIYNAFVRQFGPNRSGRKKLPFPVGEAHIRRLDSEGFAVIPPSGTFRDLIGQLDFIVQGLGCRLILLLPIHPTPTTYARMGRFGSPYAALSFTAVDPALAVFDPSATPLEQFSELVDEVHRRGAKLLIDIAINHTGWAASLHETHPGWLLRDKEGIIERPGAWGVVWEDLTRLDYSKKDLWEYMAGIFLMWTRRGVDGFRADAGYMIPIDAWIYIIAKVRDQFPNTLFLLEGLGGDVGVTRELLGRANFNFAYSELFQNYDRQQVDRYLKEAVEISQTDGVAVHFAETHDNNRLASVSDVWARMRCALCALCSVGGAFGFANGVEWLATEKINVHDASSLNWGNPVNQVTWIKRLNTVITVHPAFFHESRLEMLQKGDGNVLVIGRSYGDPEKKIIVAVNLSAEHSVHAFFEDPFPERKGSMAFTDLLSGEKIVPEMENGLVSVYLSPGKVLCLTVDAGEYALVVEKEKEISFPLERIDIQRLKAKIFEIDRIFNGMRDIGEWNMVSLMARFMEDPYSFCASLHPSGLVPFVVSFDHPVDLHREVMVPPMHFLLVRSRFPMRLSLLSSERAIAMEESFCDGKGGYFALLPPGEKQTEPSRFTLLLTLFKEKEIAHEKAYLLYLSNADRASVQTCFKKPFSNRGRDDLMLGVNGRGAMMRVSWYFRNLCSRYDALLAGNLNPRVPCDRHIMLTRFRGWCVYQGFSQEIQSDFLDRFGFDYDSNAYFRYEMHTGQGQHVLLSLRFKMIPSRNQINLSVYRHGASGAVDEYLSSRYPLTVILRPDIEDRNFHHVTKAYQGFESLWPRSVILHEKGFEFVPSRERKLCLFTDRGGFSPAAEWHYMNHRVWEEERGMDPYSDLFSPGYFMFDLKGDECATLSAHIVQSEDGGEGGGRSACSLPQSEPFEGMKAFPEKMDIIEALKGALSQYVVKRDDYETVIAGYPWFLDWGRDTLIVVRGIIAAGCFDDAESLLMQFARFEESGTLPNMIRGEDASNRNTSDAALWMFIAVSDLIGARGGETFFLDRVVPGKNRTMREVLVGMAECMIGGTPNGIFMDGESGLLYSPTHFTWMDTNHPPGTPREGYPIEIQALWHGALMLLSRIDAEKNQSRWIVLSETVRSSIIRYYYMENLGFLSDCLHTSSSRPAKEAIRDNALRPNQLFAVTLSAVTEKSIMRSIVRACERLLVPGAIRTLHDQSVFPPIVIVKDGYVVNNPAKPYYGQYLGDEDTQRKPAYHNGTAWTWVFPSYCEAYALSYGRESSETALSILSSCVQLINSGCLGHVPEIVDGNYPHLQRGCDAQAWGVSELLRVWLKLKGDKEEKTGTVMS